VRGLQLSLNLEF